MNYERQYHRLEELATDVEKRMTTLHQRGDRKDSSFEVDWKKF